MNKNRVFAFFLSAFCFVLCVCVCVCVLVVVLISTSTRCVGGLGAKGFGGACFEAVRACLCVRGQVTE